MPCLTRGGSTTWVGFGGGAFFGRASLGPDARRPAGSIADAPAEIEAAAAFCAAVSCRGAGPETFVGMVVCNAGAFVGTLLCSAGAFDGALLCNVGAFDGGLLCKAGAFDGALFRNTAGAFAGGAFCTALALVRRVGIISNHAPPS